MSSKHKYQSLLSFTALCTSVLAGYAQARPVFDVSWGDNSVFVGQDPQQVPGPIIIQQTGPQPGVSVGIGGVGGGFGGHHHRPGRGMHMGMVVPGSSQMLLRSEIDSITREAQDMSAKLSIWAGIFGGGGKKQLRDMGQSFRALMEDLQRTASNPWSDEFFMQKLSAADSSFDMLDDMIDQTAGGSARIAIGGNVERINMSFDRIETILSAPGVGIPGVIITPPMGGSQPPVVIVPPQQPQPPVVVNPPYNPPVYNPPVQNPQPPYYPQPSGDLRGYCDDYDHSQFSAAKQFAYATSGLDYDDSGAVNWALDYNRSHACGTIGEYSNRFHALYDYGYSTSYLDMDASGARNYALERVEYMTVDQTNSWKNVFRAIYNFSYSTSGLDYDKGRADSIGRQWNERGYCGREQSISAMAQQFQRDYQFAYSTGGLNYDAQGARAYALDRIRYMDRCTDLLF